MISLHSKISKNFAYELNLLYFFRDFSDGIDWFNFHINSSWFKGDHNPQHSIDLIILNLVIFEFKIYNVNHVKDEDEDEE